MLVSTKIVTRRGSKIVVSRDWRVVCVPDEESTRTTLLKLFEGICNHTYDDSEPYVPTNSSYSLTAQIGTSQRPREFQDIPLAVCVADTISSFGVYITFTVVIDGSQSTSVGASREMGGLEVFDSLNF